MIHYELPNNSEIFVHRSGRTGRAGKKGSAILMHSSRQHRDVKGIEHDAGCRFTEVRMPIPYSFTFSILTCICFHFRWRI